MIRVAGHFGEWLQGRLGAQGPLALLTVACPALHVTARRLGDGCFALCQQPQLLDVAQAAAMLTRLGVAPGRFELRASMPPGGGAGASTAALVALARAAGAPEAAIPAACLAAEGASDPLMLPRPDGVLWAAREGRSLGPVRVLPQAEIVGGFLGAPQRTDPADLRFPDVSDLVARLHRLGGLPELAAIASASAERTTALRGPAEDPTAALAQRLGALGHLRAHTGSARGLIFAPGTVPAGCAAALRAAGVSQVLRFTTGAGGQP